MERARKRRRLPRSRWVQEALLEHLSRRDEARLVEEYFESYRRVPDNDEEAKAWERIGIEDLARRDEDWR